MSNIRPLRFHKSEHGMIADLDIEGASIRFCPTSGPDFEVRIPFGKNENEKELLVVLDADDLAWMLALLIDNGSLGLGILRERSDG